MTSERKIKNRLKKARAMIVEKGWTKDNWDNEKGCVCTLGAIRFVCRVLGPFGKRTPKYSQEDYAICNDVEAYFKHATGIWNPIAWNDERNRTKEDVLAAFDKAIAA